MGGVTAAGRLTFYLDASIPLHVRQALALLRSDVIYAGGPDMPPEKTKDRQWLPLAGENDWVVLLRDKKIRTRPGERRALIDAGEDDARANPGPFVRSVTRAGVRDLFVKGI